MSSCAVKGGGGNATCFHSGQRVKGGFPPRGSRNGMEPAVLMTKHSANLGFPQSRLSPFPWVESHSTGEMTFWKVPGRK